MWKNSLIDCLIDIFMNGWTDCLLYCLFVYIVYICDFGVDHRVLHCTVKPTGCMSK